MEPPTRSPGIRLWSASGNAASVPAPHAALARFPLLTGAAGWSLLVVALLVWLTFLVGVATRPADDRSFSRALVGFCVLGAIPTLAGIWLLRSISPNAILVFLTFWGTRLAASITLVWLLSASLWLQPTVRAGAMLLLSAVVAMVVWVAIYLRAGLFRSGAVAGETPKDEELAAALADLGCTIGARQLTQLDDVYRATSSVLGERLRVGEITHRRYLGAATAVRGAAVENLRDVVIFLNNARAIDGKASETGLIDPLTPTGEPVPTERLALRDEQLSRARARLAANEQAITALGRIAAAVAATDTSLSPADVTDAIAELERLERRLGEYGSTSRA